MQLLISDANILIDLEEGQLIKHMFQLPYVFSTPDILFYEELSDAHAYLLDLGLGLNQWDGAQMMEVARRAERLSLQYRGPSRNDLLALILAIEKSCPLLTGGRVLKKAAESESVVVHGTLWIVAIMVREGIISLEDARKAFERMKAGGRRLPWELAENVLKSFDAGVLKGGYPSLPA